MVFKHHSSAKHSQRSGTAPQDERSSTAPQDERYGTSQQYERSSTAPQHERYGTADPAAGTPRSVSRVERGLPGGWLGELVLGLATLVLGLIVAFHPTHSLTVLATLLGVLMIISGVWHVIRSFHGTGDHRMWRAIGGVLFFLAGIFMLRHTGLTLSIIALFAGFAFIMAGIAALSEAVSRDHDLMVRIFAAVFGLLCLAAGIAAIVTPIHSLTRLAIVLGWAFAAMGILQMVGAIASRQALRKQSRAEQARGGPSRGGQSGVPGQRAGEATSAEASSSTPSRRGG
jgi:uncharacterized membrane protein HdeD (DUF308 family)